MQSKEDTQVSCLRLDTFYKSQSFYSSGQSSFSAEDPFAMFPLKKIEAPISVATRPNSHQDQFHSVFCLFMWTCFLRCDTLFTGLRAPFPRLPR